MYIFIFLFMFILLGFPIAFAIGLTALLYVFLSGDISNLVVIPQVMFTSLDSFPFLAVPGFILAGELMAETKITDILVELSKRLVGHIPGGLAHVNILASVFFAGMSGSALADAAGLGALEIPMMIKGGYSKEFSAAVTASSSVIGPIIPPSIVMVIYALIAGNVSIGAMFVAGFLPGILISLSLMLVCYVYAKKRKIGGDEKFEMRKVISYLKTAIIPLGMPIIIMGGILGGIFTATEASVVAIFYALLVGFFIMKTLNIRDLPRIIYKSGIITSISCIMVSMAKGLAYFLTEQEIIQKIGNIIMGCCASKEIFLLIVILIYLIIGCVFDNTSGMIISVPILLPIAMNFGINPLHFGILTNVAMCIALITPPVGACLFICSELANVPFEKLSKEILPFLSVEIIILFILAYCPSIVLFLPKLLNYI